MINKIASDRIDKLAEIPLFKALAKSKEDLKMLDAVCTVQNYSNESVVITEGDTGDDMYIVLNGAVEIRKQTISGDEYTVVLLEAKHNVFFGELSIVSEGERSATVITKSDCSFMVLSKDDFEVFCDEHPKLGLYITKEILRTVAERLRKTNTDMLTIFDALVHEIKNS